MRPVGKTCACTVATTPELSADGVRHAIRRTVRLPNPEKDDPGQMTEATYSLTGNALRVYDD
jgi:hypothetical protein